MTTISETDLSYLSQQSAERVNMILAGMTALLNDTEAKVTVLESQNWFQRMAKTVTGKNKLTQQDIQQNHEKLTAYMSEAVAELYNRGCVEQRVMVSLGAQLNELYVNQVELKQMLGAFVSRLNEKIESVDNFHLLNTEIEQGVYSSYPPLIGAVLVLSQFDNRMIEDARKLDIIKRSLTSAGIVNLEERPVIDFLSDVLNIQAQEVGRVYLELESLHGSYMAELMLRAMDNYYFLPEIARKTKKKSSIIEKVSQEENIDSDISLSMDEVYEDFLNAKSNNRVVALPTPQEQKEESKGISAQISEQDASDQPKIKNNTTVSDEELARNFKLYRADAERGDAEAQFLLGKCYNIGFGTAQNMQQAVVWYMKSAEQGNPKAQNNLGLCYEYGVGVEEDVKAAVNWFTKSADQGNKNGQCNLGECYRDGIGVEVDGERAAYLFHQAAEQGLDLAQYKLGLCYYWGIGVAENSQKAAEWFLKAAEQGYENAQDMLGDCYFYGEGVEEDKAEAVKWYQKAADQDFAPSQCSLGHCYLNGYGIEENESEAFRWFQIAAKADYPNAQLWLGKCYSCGWGCIKNSTTANEWFLKAADQGNAEAHTVWRKIIEKETALIRMTDWQRSGIKRPPSRTTLMHRTALAFATNSAMVW